MAKSTSLPKFCGTKACSRLDSEVSMGGVGRPEVNKSGEEYRAGCPAPGLGILPGLGIEVKPLFEHVIFFGIIYSVEAC